MGGDADGVRIDKWLWAARFFKTRGLAVKAIDGGKVQVNESRVKRSKFIRPGDHVRIRKGPFETRLTVRALAERRLPAKNAVELYEESEESRIARERLLEQHRLARVAGEISDGRPSKKDRRLIHRFKLRD